ncbi:hypothetical protein [Pedobacter sp. UC225_65]
MISRDHKKSMRFLGCLLI